LGREGRIADACGGRTHHSRIPPELRLEPSGHRGLTGSVRGARVIYWFGGRAWRAGRPREREAVGVSGQRGGLAQLAGGAGGRGRGSWCGSYRTDLPLAGQLRGGRPAAVTDWRGATLPHWTAGGNHARPRAAGDPDPQRRTRRTGRDMGHAGKQLPSRDTAAARPGQLRLWVRAVGRLHCPGCGGRSEEGRPGIRRKAIPGGAAGWRRWRAWPKSDWRHCWPVGHVLTRGTAEGTGRCRHGRPGDPGPGNAIHNARNQVTMIGGERRAFGDCTPGPGILFARCHLTGHDR